MTSRDSVEASLSIHRPQPHDDIPELDTDVMEAICGSIDGIHDLLSVSLTCSVMWRIAIRQLLRTHTIRLNTREAIRGFRDFILNQKLTRAPHIHSLAFPELAWTSVPSILVEREGNIMDILDCAVNLKALSLYFDDCIQPARVTSAFAAMGALRYLSLDDPEIRWAHHALGALRSSPQMLCLSRGGKLGDASRVALHPPAARFSEVFSRFSSSSVLTSLHLDWIPMYDNSFLDIPRFCSVRSLAITKPLEREPKLDCLLHLFPSLDGTLSLRLEGWRRTQLAADPRRLAEALGDNRRSQEVSRWTKLDRLDCDSMTLQILRLQCPVHHCTIDTFDIHTIAGIRPHHLVVSSICLPFHIAPVNLATQTLAFATVDSAGFYPTHVVLIVSCTQDDFLSARALQLQNSDVRWAVVFERLQQTLAIFKNVTHARLVFHCHRQERSIWGPEIDEPEVVAFICEMRERAFVSRLSPTPSLLAACPRLRYFFVTACGRDDTPSAMASQRHWIQDGAWRVVESIGEEGRSGGANGESALPMLEELSHYTARRIIEAEDLGLPEEWEQKLAFCRV